MVITDGFSGTLLKELLSINHLGLNSHSIYALLSVEGTTIHQSPWAKIAIRSMLYFPMKYNSMQILKSVLEVEEPYVVEGDVVTVSD